MTIKWNGALSRCLRGLALGALTAVAFIRPAAAQWMPAWGAPFAGDIEQGLEAQGYVLTAPLMRRPGVYLADVSAGPAGHQRLIIDARSGQILERFPAPGRRWGPALAARDTEFGGPSPLSRGLSGPNAPIAPATNAGRGNVHIPAAISPYDVMEPRAGVKVKLKPATTERKATINPPLPPPAPRETAKADGLGSAAPMTTENPNLGRARLNSASTEAVNVPSPSAPQSLPALASDKPKVSIVAPGLFQ